MYSKFYLGKGKKNKQKTKQETLICQWIHPIKNVLWYICPLTVSKLRWPSPSMLSPLLSRCLPISQMYFWETASSAWLHSIYEAKVGKKKKTQQKQISPGSWGHLSSSFAPHSTYDRAGEAGRLPSADPPIRVTPVLDLKKQTVSLQCFVQLSSTMPSAWKCPNAELHKTEEYLWRI